MKPRKSTLGPVSAALTSAAALMVVALAMGGCDLQSLFNRDTGGTPQPTPNSPPVVTFTKPASALTVYQGQSVPIVWYTSDQEDGTTVRLYIDQDGIKQTQDDVLLTQVARPAGDTGPSSYTWSTTDYALGDYRIFALANDGTNPAVAVYNPHVVTIVSAQPTIQVTEPHVPMSVEPAENLVIKWDQYAPQGASTVKLYYDVDTNLGNGLGTLIDTVAMAAGASSGEYTWNVPALPGGQYYILAVLNDGVASSWSYGDGASDPKGVLGISGPALTVVNPAADTAWQGSLAIRFIADVPEGDPTARIFLDLNEVPGEGNEQQIVSGLAVQSGQYMSYVWQSDTVTPGTYHVGVTIDDGVNAPLTDYASGRIIVIDPDNPDDITPTISLTDPSTMNLLSPGASLTIRWTDEAGGNASIALFYDTDLDATNNVAAQTFHTAQEDPDGVAGDSYAWTIPDTLTGSTMYVIGATLSDGSHDPVTVYAPGTFTVLDRDYFTYSLGEVEARQLGRTLRGFSPNGYLGKVTAHVPWKWVPDPKDAGAVRRQPGISTNGDTYDDFILTAPTGDSFYLERVKAGESYLVLSEPNVLFGVPVVGGFRPIVVSATGSPSLPGALFSGPAITSPATSTGIGAVALSRDADGDGTPDIVFGIPHADRIVHEGQDYDPWDDYEYQIALAEQPDNPPGRTEFAVQYLDRYRNPPSGTEINPDGLPTDQTDWRNITAAMLVAVAGRIPAITASPSLPPGAPELQQIVIPLDSVGQPSIDPHPRAVNGTMADMRGPDGVRFYCPWWFRNSSAEYGDHTGGPFGGPGVQFDIQTPFDGGYFGNSLIEADLDGDGRPEWIANQPFDPEPTDQDGSNEGWLHVIWSDKTTLWNAPYSPTVAPGAWQNSGWVRVDVTTVDIDIAADGTTTTDTDSTTGSQQGPPAFNWGAWSWPYAFTSGNCVLSVTVTTTTDNTQDPAVVTEEIAWEADDARERWYCWPVVSDYIQGDPVEAPNGTQDAHLGGLANVGDFNKDFREDITIGAPHAAPNGNAAAGVTYMILGRPAFADHSLATVGKLVPGAMAGIKVIGENAGDKVGTAQASAGDFNGDGLSDWVIGVPGYDNGRGLVAVVFGNLYIQGTFKVSDIGTAKLPGLIFTGEAVSTGGTDRADNLGQFVSGVGDVNGDGYDDIAIAAPGANSSDGSREDCGRVYVIYGAPDYYDASTPANNVLSLEDAAEAVPALIFEGPIAGNEVGTVAPAGDVNADSLADILIGNPNKDIVDPDGGLILPKTGEVYLIRGAPRPNSVTP